MGKFSKDKRDIFYRLAKERGYRARSAFKLMHLDTEFALFNQRGNALLVNRAVDLCAAPGSWSQVLADKLYSADEDPTKADPPKIIAVDLQPMAPVDGVLCLQGDITSEDTARRIISHFQGQRAELVVCDGAPDVTGLHDIDEFLQGQLLLSAMMITTHVLCPNGTFVAKIFRGKNVDFLYEQLRHLFGRVSIAKPSSSRNSSLESFVVCERFKGAPYLNMPLDIGGYLSVNDIVNSANDQNVEGFGMSPGEVAFFACGDLTGWKPHGVDNNGNDDVLDADKSYPVDQSKDHIAPIAPPIEPPYQTSIEKQKADRQKRS